jgi:four helix bundle protein
MIMNRKIEKFEDLIVWQESVKLSIELYRQLKNCKDFGLRDQMQRSAVSIPSNIAEGFERKSNKEFIQFLYISLGSCAELRTQLYIAEKTEIIQSSTCKAFLESTKSISAMLRSLIETRKTKFK